MVDIESIKHRATLTLASLGARKKQKRGPKDVTLSIDAVIQVCQDMLHLCKEVERLRKK